MPEAGKQSIITMSVPEVSAFADRLGDGADSLVTEAQAQAADLKAAARVIKGLLRAFNNSDLVRLSE